MFYGVVERHFTVPIEKEACFWRSDKRPIVVEIERCLPELIRYETAICIEIVEKNVKICKRFDTANRCDDETNVY